MTYYGPNSPEAIAFFKEFEKAEREGKVEEISREELESNEQKEQENAT